MLLWIYLTEFEMQVFLGKKNKTTNHPKTIIFFWYMVLGFFS